MIESCADDAWVDEDGLVAFVIYSLHPVEGIDAQVGFAVDIASSTLLSVRLLLAVPEGVLTRPVDILLDCGVNSMPCAGRVLTAQRHM